MIPIITRITYPDHQASKRALVRITREGHRLQGEHFVKHMLPGHFKAGAASKYGYRPRSPKTIRQKRADSRRGKAIYGGQVPLVWTGALKAAAASASVRAFPSRARVNVAAPHYIGMRPRTGRHPNIAAEMFAVLPAEEAALGGVLQKSVEAGLIAAQKKTRTVTAK